MLVDASHFSIWTASVDVAKGQAIDLKNGFFLFQRYGLLAQNDSNYGQNVEGACQIETHLKSSVSHIVHLDVKLGCMLFQKSLLGLCCSFHLLLLFFLFLSLMFRIWCNFGSIALWIMSVGRVSIGKCTVSITVLRERFVVCICLILRFTPLSRSLRDVFLVVNRD
jgi:hypothetical protein